MASNLLLSLALALLPRFASPTSSPITVSSPAGLVTGTRDGGVDSFLGIRYGHAARFQAASRYTYPGGGPAGKANVTALETGAWCYQATAPIKPSPDHTYAEDCLFLNIWRPAAGMGSSKRPTPIAFWVHGGGFTQGSGSDPLFVGHALAASQGMIVVTINYRLGPLGFLVHDSTGKGGMHGLADVVVALKWVRDNAAAFGGDRDRVMVFGESAGGMATCTLSVSPAAKGLLRSSIVQSGPCVGPWQPVSTAIGIAERDALFLVHGTTSLDGLTTVPAENLTWPIPTGGYFLDDGLIMGKQPSEYLAAGELNVESIVFGGNSFDGTSALEPFFPARNATNAQYVEALVLRYASPAKAAAIAARYSLSRFGGDAQAAFNEADSDHVVACPNVRMARMLAAAAAKREVQTVAAANANMANSTSTAAVTAVRVYRYAHLQPQCDMGNVLGVVPAGLNFTDSWASHGAELPLVFDVSSFPNPLNSSAAAPPIHCEWTPGERSLVDSIQSLWGSMAATGVPRDSTAAAVEWPEWEAGEAQGGVERTLILTTQPGTPGSHTEDGVKHDDCSYWDQLNE